MSVLSRREWLAAALWQPPSSLPEVPEGVIALIEEKKLYRVVE